MRMVNHRQHPQDEDEPAQDEGESKAENEERRVFSVKIVLSLTLPAVEGATRAHLDILVNALLIILTSLQITAQAGVM